MIHLRGQILHILIFVSSALDSFRLTIYLSPSLLLLPFSLLCPTSLTYLQPHSFLLSPLFLPASCCSGPPGSYSLPSHKGKDGKQVQQLRSLSFCHSLSICVSSLRESSWSLMSQSCPTVTHT